MLEPCAKKERMCKKNRHQGSRSPDLLGDGLADRLVFKVYQAQSSRLARVGLQVPDFISIKFIRLIS